MFEVLVFVYENYWRGDACPEPQRLGRKLSAHGFESTEISAALVWLDGLNAAAKTTRLSPLPTVSATAAPAVASDAAPSDAPSPPLASIAPARQWLDSMRVYSVAEQDHLGAECLGFVVFLESAGVLPVAMREIVIDRAMAAPGGPVPLDDLKIIVLMVFWSFGEEPDALVLDELCDDASDRVAH